MRALRGAFDPPLELDRPVIDLDDIPGTADSALSMARACPR